MSMMMIPYYQSECIILSTSVDFPPSKLIIVSYVNIFIDYV